ncbi:phenylalanine--tRNA ligase subunit alpha [Candidatus Daviesbacteria bacterium]|nr:phenylalanine--tRNA ligase subunit alpha [Candidatus Daviesbacteria bacterium]
MQEKLVSIKQKYLDQINKAKDLKELDQIFLALFGKSGQLTLLPKQFPKISQEERKRVGPLFNSVKQELENAITQKRAEVRERNYAKLASESPELVKTEIKKREGNLHPITEFENKIADLFKKIGFQQFDGPHIDTDEYNFGLLNIPPEHPARDMWDTLYIKGHNEQAEGELLLRTHTSDAQAHIMKQYKPPIRMMIIGRCFRYENLDPRHEHTFDQFEIVYIDKGLSLANLQYLSEYLFRGMLGENTKVRLSPGYYPFTEPSAHIFGSCIFCKGKGCQVCGATGELELAGAGMIHPNVLRNCGIDPEVYSGIAWGVGPGRMAMLKYDVADLRLFNSGDLKFLQKL